VLEGKKPVEEQLGHVGVLLRGDPDDAAVMPELFPAVFHAGM
jgi:hypothetical protein